MKSSWKWHGPITIQNSFWYCALFSKWKVKGRPWTIQQICSLVWVQIHCNGTRMKKQHKNLFFTGTHSSLWNRTRFTKIPQPEAHILPFGTECNLQKYQKPTQKFVWYRHTFFLVEQNAFYKFARWKNSSVWVFSYGYTVELVYQNLIQKSVCTGTTVSTGEHNAFWVNY